LPRRIGRVTLGAASPLASGDPEVVAMTRAVALLSVCLFAGPAAAQSLSVIEEADWDALRVHGRQLVKNLQALDILPADTVKALQPLLEQKKPDDPRQAVRAVQKLLDAHCLIAVTINPQSRVKAARGPRKAELLLDQPTSLLIKVHNDGGVTHPLAADSPQRLTSGKKDRDPDRWLELTVRNDRLFTASLSGDKVEYRVLKLTARQAGKREATIAFDVGQGTQDLGFRAEVPILFTVRPK
jgi:hypothetical protein